MKMQYPTVARWLGIFLVLSTSFLLAEPEVRRAFPTSGSDSSEETVVRPATPVPNSTPRAENSSEAIRIGPSENPASAAKLQLEGANSLYVRKMYDLAVPEYEKYLDTYPEAEERDAALFRLAESHRFLGYKEMAVADYSRLIREFPFGEFTGPAAYRLGEIFFSARNYAGALLQFQSAAANVKKEEVRTAALFYQARCLEKLNYRAKAIALYKQVASIEKNNPFHDDALLAVARSEADAGHLQPALNRFDQVAQVATDPAVRAEANVRGAMLASSLNQLDSAIRRFREAIATGSPEWKSPAWLGLFELLYQKKDYTRIVDEQSIALPALSPDVQADGLLLVANSYRQLNQPREAIKIYDRLIQEFPQSKQIREAQLQRLFSLYSVNDPSLLDAIHSFEQQETDPTRLHQVLLLKAETLFRKKQYADAAFFFRKVQETGLPAQVQADALYKLGWSYAHSGRLKEAIAAYSDFIRNYPENSLIPSTWLQRGLARQQNKEIAGALSDYDTLIHQFPQAREREVGLLQRGLLLGAEGDKANMSETFRQLLSDYPHTAAAAQANFWIGWAAYEDKDYQSAIDYLNKARTLDRTHYQEKASLRILLAYYYLKNVEAASREAASLNSQSIPAEILRWLGMESFQRGRYADAERYLLVLQKNHLIPSGESADSASLSADISLFLARAQLNLKKYSAAWKSIENYLVSAHDPISRGEGLFVQAQILKEQGKIDEALKLAQEVQLLEPEGMANAHARLLEADLRMRQKDYLQAGRDYMAVALLYDDAQLSPQALRAAVEAFKQADHPAEEERALAQLKKRFPNASPP